MKYKKPISRDLNDLTPALGQCSSGNADGACAPGTLAGGTGGCVGGTNAFVTCRSGNEVFIASECDAGTGIDVE